MTEEDESAYVHTDSLEWPNGEGFTPCTEEYRKLHDEKEAICSINNGGVVDDLSPEDYQKWHVLDNQLGTLQLAGHLGQGERI